MGVETYRPANLEELLEELPEKNYWLFAGGTDLMIRKRQWQGASRRFKRPIMFIYDVPEMRGVEWDDDYLYIGSTTTLQTLGEHEKVPKILKEALLKMASPPIRHMATIGGNICNAAKVGDTLPVLFLLNARVELLSRKDRRIEKISDFIKGKYETDLRAGEILYRIWIPRDYFSVSKYYKLGLRHGDILSKLTVSCVLSLEGNTVTDFRVAFGAINNKPIRDVAIEKKILYQSKKKARGNTYTMLEEYKRLLHGETDKRSTRLYRESVAIKLLYEFLKEELYE